MLNSFDKNWEENIYSKGKAMNKYPFDILVSLIYRLYQRIPFDQRKKIKVLDLGCGAGNNAIFLAEFGFSVYGVDGSQSAIKHCQQVFKKKKLKGKFLVRYFLDLPYKKLYFDLIIDRGSLCCNKFTEIISILTSLFKILKKRGVLISYFPSNKHPDKKYGYNIENNTFSKFSKGAFYNLNKISFINYNQIAQLFGIFKLRNIISYSLKEQFCRKKTIIEDETYIIIAEK